MNVFSYHLVKMSFFSAFRAMIFPIKSGKIKGLIHAETMSAMVLCSPIYSINRIFSRKIIVFAQWENEKSLHQFLENHQLGRKLEKGWHIRLEFLRQWGNISGFKIPNQTIEINEN